MTRLPDPLRSRWQPLRIGLVDLFHYDVEEFHFKDGRLLLRGNNGTGKSKVLALTLPFLLDGDLTSRRVEPDGDPGKRMEWNLLLGGEHPHSERLGYTWIEFGRVDESTGERHFRTLLCGLKAVSGRGIARHWYALTSQRVDHGPAPAAEASLSLLDATGTALSRDRLAEALAGHGMVYDQARTYRRAVDEALFGLGEQRYGALVDLLIQLRQPQLSKRPNEAALSRALTEALPPMDQAVIADVAEAFRSLDEEKEELAAATAAERAATAFLDHYRRYARIATRRRARTPRGEHSRYEHIQRDLVEAQAQQTRAQEARAAAEERITALEETRARLRAQDAALREGPEMRSARELEQAAKEAERTDRARIQARDDRHQAAGLHSRALGRLTTAENRLGAADRLAEDTLRTAREAAAAARIDLPGDDGPRGPELRLAADRSMDRGHRALAHAEDLAETAERAAQGQRQASVRLDEADTDLDQTVAAQDQAEEAAARAARALLDDVRENARAWTELDCPDPVGLLDELQDWTRHLDGPYPARVHAARAHSAASARLADEAADAARRTAELEVRIGRFREELTMLEAGGRRGPRPPLSRTPGLREWLSGAPLWRLVDFHDHLPEPQRARLEAALEASGLLDAWVLPDGTALAADGYDVLLAPLTGPVAGPSLGGLLRPAVDSGDAQAAAVGEDTVARLLAAIGAGGDGGTDTWAGPDGRFRVGPLTGRWAKPAAEYVGEGAREAARRTRIATLRAELGGLRLESDTLVARSERVAARRRTLDAELAGVPEESPLTRAHAQVTAAVEAVRRTRSRREERAADLLEAAGRAEAAATELAGTTAELGLPADRAGLAEVRRALGSLALSLAALWPTLRERDEAVLQAEEERAEVAQAGERTAELTWRADEAGRAAVAADERHATLRSTIGAAVVELERRLTETAEALRTCEADQRTTRQRHGDADREASKAEGHIERLEKNLAEAAGTRAEAIAGLQRFTATGLIKVALPDLTVPTAGDVPWAATPAITLARAIESGLASTDDSDSAWERVQRRLSEELKTLQDTLSRHGHTASARMVEDGMVVDIVYQGRERAVPELAEALTAEVGELTRILSAHEREILETHLITEVAGTLQELIGAAERQVRDMNAELDDRPTSTGMKLRLVWRASRKAPSGLATARERLRQSADAWTPEDRAAVGEFLQTQIARQQTDDTSGSWLEHLTAALDYRAWHEFGVERHQHGRWVPATGPASGGERVLAVSVPLFAAASSHYASAGSPYAPRLVTLDEAFAGVDDDSRAKCLGLLHAFDLDVVMTSEREWACYPQVPGVAIAQLSRIDEVAAVLVTRWEWDGNRRIRREDPVRSQNPKAGPLAEAAAGPEPLWT
ncbi:TIGR02680 family protein [Streptomyces sp. SID4919]|uniref:TIGR02680 family protein n=1 Tax=unclassified Streptomyces TaxID=2593676 RepID=UPI000823CB24|nr:TIGR02680 family protein [Streptomyces sp. AmelKG-E11A]MYY07654.1 TIGR02680 family protein [Streptomyces sp. SID4919]SCK52686.1 TIGR02680 family protein [Streptomyces sp. AmelKG-E11A]